MDQIPSWHEFMIPVLEVLRDGKTRHRTIIRESVSETVGLSDVQKFVKLASGQSKANNRIGWAVSHLTRVGALDRVSRGNYQITPIGSEMLNKFPTGISESVLRSYAKPDDEWWKPAQKPAIDEVKPGQDEESELDPTEQIEQGMERIHSTVAADLLARLQEGHPAFFELVVVRLLVAMGYGGVDGSATVTQLTNDEGIDGVIDRDALGLDRVYIQAKRYKADRTVQRPDLQSFVGALSGKATTGVFITTGRFSHGAIEYAKTAHTRVILIDGKRLTELMIRYGVGVQNRQTLHIVAVDDDFFE